MKRPEAVHGRNEGTRSYCRVAAYFRQFLTRDEAPRHNDASEATLRQDLGGRSQVVCVCVLSQNGLERKNHCTNIVSFRFRTNRLRTRLILALAGIRLGIQCI